MIFILENNDKVKEFLKKEFKFNIEEDIANVDDFKFKVFPNMLNSAKEILGYSTCRNYRNAIDNLDNRHTQRIKNVVMSFGSAMYKKYNKDNDA
ncbi:MAG: hypothetical protein ACM31H_05560 [Nitrososphaerales archaeon]